MIFHKRCFGALVMSLVPFALVQQVLEIGEVHIPLARGTYSPFLKAWEESFSSCSIALTSCICKVLERLMNARLVWQLGQRNILSPA